ncbi:MAG: selenocysteine-specific translation elongation factor [Chloroflexi bacterium]|nr:selenocysteine-specific translation elongation factor [Chloroflexota bacterium]
MYVIGTAGHVDHGKSALVQALTGIDPDRLREEKERGMTIDLGFAWLRLPSGREVSIVDVPGHERFIKNMLAGVGGIDLALLVVAADEGVMPQTRVHLAIIDLLQIRSGVVALSKRDLVDAEWLELVKADLQDTLRGTVLEEAPLVAVSAVTGEGLPGLLASLDSQLESMEPKRDIGRPRLPIDRVFTISGFGTVVTGTLIDGSLSVGQEVEVLPGGLRTRIRGLQTHSQRVSEVEPGSRVAANLSGVATSDLGRGQVVASPGWLSPSDAFDVRLRVLPALERPLRHNTAVTFHTGASETEGKVRLLEGDDILPGQEAWAQVRLRQPVAAVKGDYFIIRSPNETLGGGQIVVSGARRHRRLDRGTLQGLAMLAHGGPRETVLQQIAAAEPCDIAEVAKRSAISQEETIAAVGDLAAEGQLIVLGSAKVGPQSLLYSRGGWLRLLGLAKEALAGFHRQFPLRSGMDREEFRSRLRLPARALNMIITGMAADGALVQDGTSVRLPSHSVEMTAAQQESVERFIRALEASPFAPPSDALPEPAVLGLLLEQGRVVKVDEGVVFSAQAYEEMVSRVREYMREHGKITIAEVRDLLGTSRKYALALMEHLDEKRVTRRVGDERVLR